jgi:hypothetical protein
MENYLTGQAGEADGDESGKIPIAFGEELTPWFYI